MKIEAQLLQKHGLVAMKLARELLTMNALERIPTIDEFSRKYEAGRGTVQAALRLLIRHQAIELEARGHLGTFIAAINYERLWEYTGLGTLMGVMPLPYTRRYEGLATGLYRVMQDRKVPFSLAYMRGAQARLQALQSGRYDFAVVSALAAVQALDEGMDIEVAVAFGQYTYVNEHVMLFADAGKPELEDGMKVGVDRSSIDHLQLTMAQCGDKAVSLIDLAYNQIIGKLQNAEIDAAVWNVDEIIERRLDIPWYPLRQVDRGVRDTEAVMVINKNSYGVKNLFAVFIDRERVVEYQRQVVTGEIIPGY